MPYNTYVGLYTNTQSNINEPLVGMWELGRETIQVVGSSLQDLKSHFVPIIPFGTLQIDSRYGLCGKSGVCIQSCNNLIDNIIFILLCCNRWIME